MEIDIFEDEQRIYDRACAYVKEIEGGADLDVNEYTKIVKEYGKLLKQLRRSTKIADRTTIGLHEDNINLTGKVHLDPLTRIYNRRFMEDNLLSTLKTLSRTCGELSLLMIDIDFFKKYNDTYGHSSGDICLKLIAETIAGSLSRNDDFAARYGGEEFAVILPGTGEEGSRFVAEKILGNIRALNIPHETSGIAKFVTVSIGITSGKVEHTQTAECYIKRADKALYMSKNSGRAKYTYLKFSEVEL